MTTKDFNWLNVLLVDDSLSILTFVKVVLEDKYQISNIMTASSGQEAIQLLRHPTSINLVFLDLNMPNVDGIQLLKKIKDLNYNGYVVIMSGVSTRIITSVELLSKQYGLNYVGTLLKPLHESDFDLLFKKMGSSRKKIQETESLKEYEIIRAIKNDDIEVLYQPQIDLRSRTFIGVEALCRMNHPRLGCVSPDRFIDKAEKSLLIVHITWQVFKKAMAAWQQWSQQDLHIKLSVNASPIALQQPEFADIVLTLLTQFNIPTQQLCIEVTETILAEDQAQELMNLSRLNMKGVEIALDDFGKKNSTVERLRKLPLTYLKLDKSFFVENRDSMGQMAVISTSVALANELKIKTIAEGVEDVKVLNLVTEIGCDYGQGFYIAKPMPAKDIISWMKEWQSQT